MEPDRRLLEAHRRVERDGPARCAAGGCGAASRWSGSSTGGCSLGAPPRCEAGLPGRVEGGAERVVERAQPDLVAGGDLLAGANETRAGSALLGVDDRPQDPFERRVQALHERVRVVEAAAVDAYDDLRPRRVERLALQSLDRLAAHLAVQVPGAGPRVEAGERRLVRGAAGQDDEAAAARRPGRAERDRLRGSTDDDPRSDAALKLDLVVEQHRPLRVGLRRRVADELERLAGQARATARGSRPRGSAASCTRSDTSLRKRALGGSRRSASGTVTRVPSWAIPSSRRIARVAAASRTWV